MFLSKDSLSQKKYGFFSFLWNEFFVEKDEEVQEKICTWPNGVTALGIIGVGIYVYQYVWATVVWLIPLTAFLIGTSDLLDGLLARRLNQHTRLGKILDPLRDRMFSIALCGNVVLLKGEPAFLPASIWILCDLTLFVQDFLTLSKKQPLSTHSISKTGQAATLLCIGIILGELYWLQKEIIPALWLIWITALIALVNRCASLYITARSL